MSRSDYLLRVAVALHALGTRVDVVITGDSALELEGEVRRAWAWCLTDDPSPGVEVHVAADGDPVEALDRLTTEIVRTGIGAGIGSLFMLHGAALADPATGRCLVLVAPSGTGKTTATMTLGTSLGYVTDETVGIAADRTVLPFAKPLSLLPRPKRQLPPDDLGLLRPPAVLTVGRIALLDRSDTGPQVPEVEPLGTVAALATLAAQTSSLSALPAPLHRVADLLDATGGLVRLHYREAEDLRPLVPSLLGIS